MSYMIEPKCPCCGTTVKVKIHKVDRLEAENADLRRTIKALKMVSENETSFGNSFLDALRGRK